MSVSREFRRTFSLLTGTLVLVAGALVMSWGMPTSATGGPPGAASGDGSFVPDQLIVRFAPGSDPADRRGALQSVKARGSDSLAGIPGTRLVEIPEDGSVPAAVARANASEGVLWAEPNYILQIQQLPNDPRLGLQWGIRNVGQNTLPSFEQPFYGKAGVDVNAAAAWERTTEGGGRVAVVDSGIDPDHPDLIGNLNFAASRNFVPETPVPGSPVNPDAWQDVQGHGTHVAGIIGATGNNGLGVAGVNWDVRMLSLRACTESGSCTAAAVSEAFAYAGSIGVPVVNASLGLVPVESTPEKIEVLSETVAAHPETLYVVAAGNGDAAGEGYDVDQQPIFPCSLDLDNVLCVAALAADGELTGFSNWGGNTVDVGAPGHYIESTYVAKEYPFTDHFDEGLGEWDQEPYAWSEGELEGRATMRFDATDGGVDVPVPSASATLRYGMDLDGLKHCWAKVELALELHGNQTFSIQAQTGAGPAATLPGAVLGAGSLPAGQRFAIMGLLGAFDGQEDVKLRLLFEANGTPTPRPLIDIVEVEVSCIGEMLPGGLYESLSGTSMATPFVAGIASLGLSLSPLTRGAPLRQAILDTAVPTASLDGKTVSGGRVDARALLDQLAPPVTRPARLRLRVAPAGRVVRQGQVTVFHGAARNTGGRAARGFRLCIQTPRVFSGTRCTRIGPLARGAVRRVRFRVRAHPRARPGRYTARISARAANTEIRVAPVRLNVTRNRR